MAPIVALEVTIKQTVKVPSLQMILAAQQHQPEIMEHTFYEEASSKATAPKQAGQACAKPTTSQVEAIKQATTQLEGGWAKNSTTRGNGISG